MGRGRGDTYAQVEAETASGNTGTVSGQKQLLPATVPEPGSLPRGPLLAPPDHPTATWVGDWSDWAPTWGLAFQASQRPWGRQAHWARHRGGTLFWAHRCQGFASALHPRPLLTTEGPVFRQLYQKV